MYVALARKYRPRFFSDLIAQEHVARGLRGAVELRRVAHAYLLCGPRGVGKTTAARILAMALNCETRHAGGQGPAPGEPCGRCTSCERIWSGTTSLDVVEIDAASNRGVDDARDLRERARYAASEAGRSKVYIVDEAHMLTREAWNALLKILEEPPPSVVFVFATTEPQKIESSAAPVMSRLQRFDFRRLGPAAIAHRLQEVVAAEGLDSEPEALRLIARVADGGMRDALSVLDQVAAFGDGGVTLARVRELLGLVGDEAYCELLEVISERRAASVFPLVARLVEAGEDLGAFVAGAADVLRALLAATLRAEPEPMGALLAAAVKDAAARLVPGDVLRMLRALEEAEEAIRRGPSPRLAVETLLARWVLMDRTVAIEDLLTRGPASEPVGLERLKVLWPDVVAAAQAVKPLLAQALAEVEPVALDGQVIRLRAVGDNPIAAEGIARNRAAIATLLGRWLPEVSRVVLEPPEPGAPAAGRPRVSASDARTERTERLRAKNPALDAAIETLDLELLD